jgi:rhodanese-related sulfurtransferase
MDALRGDGGGVAVLSADPGFLRIPGAHDLSFAARDDSGGAALDETQRRLAALIDQMTGGDRARPVTVYGRETAARSGYDLAGRLVRLGYRRVIWLREGLAGWAAAGLPLAIQED